MDELPTQKNLEFPDVYAARTGFRTSDSGFGLELRSLSRVRAEFEMQYGLPVVLPECEYLEQEEDTLSGLRCTICLGVCCRAMEAVCCSVLACEDCEAAAHGQNVCPCRRQGEGFRPSRPIRRVIDNLNVQCVGCGANMKRDRFEAHSRAACPSARKKIKCPSNDIADACTDVRDGACNWTGPMSELPDHLEHDCHLGLAVSTARTKIALQEFDQERGWRCTSEEPANLDEESSPQ